MVSREGQRDFFEIATLGASSRKVKACFDFYSSSTEDEPMLIRPPT